MHLGAVAGVCRYGIATAARRGGIHEVLVQVIGPFNVPVVQRTGDGDVVEQAQVLHVFAQPHAAGMRTNRNVELVRQQQYSDDLVDATEAAGVDLREVDGVGL